MIRGGGALCGGGMYCTVGGACCGGMWYCVGGATDCGVYAVDVIMGAADTGCADNKL